MATPLTLAPDRSCTSVVVQTKQQKKDANPAALLTRLMSGHFRNYEEQMAFIKFMARFVPFIPRQLNALLEVGSGAIKKPKLRNDAVIDISTHGQSQSPFMRRSSGLDAKIALLLGRFSHIESELGTQAVAVRICNLQRLNIAGMEFVILREFSLLEAMPTDLLQDASSEEERGSGIVQEYDPSLVSQNPTSVEFTEGSPHFDVSFPFARSMVDY